MEGVEYLMIHLLSYLSNKISYLSKSSPYNKTLLFPIKNTRTEKELLFSLRGFLIPLDLLPLLLFPALHLSSSPIIHCLSFLPFSFHELKLLVIRRPPPVMVPLPSPIHHHQYRCLCHLSRFLAHPLFLRFQL